MNPNTQVKLSLVLLSLLVAVSIANTCFITSVGNTLSEMILSLPNEATDATDELSAIKSYWESNKTLVSLTIPRSETDAVSEQIDIAIVSAEENSSVEYKKSMARLLRAIDNLVRLERLNLDILQ